MTEIASIKLWHKRARPEPTARDFNVQLGCHLEEVVEMLTSISGGDGISVDKINTAAYIVSSLAEGLKLGTYDAWVINRKEFLDACCDQIVTAVGAAHCADMDVVKGMDIVQTSNWSKTVNGEFLRDENGKIKKPPSYVAPDLGDCV